MKSRASRSILSLVFLVFDLGLYFLSIYAFTQENAIINTLKNIWDKASLKDVKDALEKNFECCGWDTATCEKPSCKSVIEPKLKKYWKAGAGSLLGLALLLTIGVILAFKVSCSSDNYRNINDQDTLHSQPDIGDGLPAEPKTEYKYSW
jgi:hypothetical protein